MAAIPAGCERRSALFSTGVAVTATRELAVYKDYAANVLRCELLTLFWWKRHRSAFFRDRRGLQEMVSLRYVMCISTNWWSRLNVG